MTETPVLAPLVGTMSQQLVENGTKVEAGEVICEIEAMKMMFSVEAPVAGSVRFIAQLGQVVGQDEIVAVIESE